MKLMCWYEVNSLVNKLIKSSKNQVIILLHYTWKYVFGRVKNE